MSQHAERSESVDREGDQHGSRRRRPSRAGTRSVTTLSTAQLERKRANDREAQRAIRARTKEHIDQLTQQLCISNANAEASDRLLRGAQQRIRQLEDELTFLKTRASGDDSFIIGVPSNEVRPVDSAISLSSDTSSSPVRQYMRRDAPRTLPEAHRGTMSAHAALGGSSSAWREDRNYTPTPVVSSTSSDGLSNGTSWRNAHDVAGAANMSLITSTPSITMVERPHKDYANTSPTNPSPRWDHNTSYGYLVDSSQSTTPRPTKKQRSFPDIHNTEHFGTSNTGMGSASLSQHTNYAVGLATPSVEFQGLSMQGNANATSLPAHVQHSAYSIASGPSTTSQGYQVPPQTPMRNHVNPQQYMPATPTASYDQPGMPQGTQMPFDYHGTPQQQQQQQQTNYTYTPYATTH